MRLIMEKMHSYEGEALQKKNEISELQKILSDSHLAVYDERHYLMRLKGDYDKLSSIYTIHIQQH